MEHFCSLKNHWPFNLDLHIYYHIQKVSDIKGLSIVKKFIKTINTDQ